MGGAPPRGGPLSRPLGRPSGRAVEGPYADQALHVTLTAPPAPPCVYVFARGPVLVGRGLSCELCVPLPSVSVHHLTLTWSPQGLTARDAHAKNKAEARGLPITPDAPLLAGAHAVITLPGARLELRLAPLDCAPTTAAERTARTAQLWRPESGWLLRWRPQGAPSSGRHAPPLSPPLSSQLPLEAAPELRVGDGRVEPALSEGGERLWALPFGERLSLRDAAYGNGEGLPSALLNTPSGPHPSEAALSIEVTPQGLSLHALTPPHTPSAPLTLTPGARLPWRGGHLELAPAAPPSPSPSPARTPPLTLAPTPHISSEAGEVDALNHRLLRLFLSNPWAFRLLLALLIGALAILLRALRGEGGL